MIYEGSLNPKLEGRIAIIVARFNETITDRLLQGALKKFQECGVSEEIIDVFYVPGTFEIPTVSEKLAKSEKYCGILCLGAVIRGETTHDQHINRAVSMMFAEQGARYGKPVMFGVLTCNNVEQALARSIMTLFAKEDDQRQLLDSGMRDAAVAKALGGSPYAAEMTVKNARRLSAARLTAALTALANVDALQKQGLARDSDSLLLAVMQNF